jgi:hypothetical protein
MLLFFSHPTLTCIKRLSRATLPIRLAAMLIDLAQKAANPNGV